MKLHEIKAMFPDSLQKLREAMVGGKEVWDKAVNSKDPKEEVTSESNFAPNLFKSEERDIFIPMYLEAVNSAHRDSIDIKRTTRLIEKFQAEQKNHATISNGLKEKIVNIINVFNSIHPNDGGSSSRAKRKAEKQEKKKDKKDKEYKKLYTKGTPEYENAKRIAKAAKKAKKAEEFFKSNSSSSSSSSSTQSSDILEANDTTVLEKFPEQSYLLASLADQANRSLEEHEVVVKEIDRRVKRDSLIVKRRFENKDFDGAYEYNRVGPGKGIDLRASNIKMPDRQNYIAAGCPRQADQHALFFEELVKQGGSLLVSAHQTRDASWCTKFWENGQKGYVVKTSDGWTITNIGQTTLADGISNEYSKNKPTKILETKLLAVHDKSDQVRELTHLHYENWQDHNPAPDLRLLTILLDRIEELSPSREIPFSVNCKGGVGRTGIITVGYYLRREIDAQLNEGKRFDQITINIPETIYQFRKQRKGMCGNAVQLKQLYAITDEYVKRLQPRVELISISTPLDQRLSALVAQYL